MSSSDQPLDEGKTVETDLDRLVGREFSSGKRHTLRLRKESWVPWLAFTNHWNSANAYNLALFSNLAYEDGTNIDNLFENIRDKESAKIEMEGNRLVDGGPRKLLTRNVVEGDHFKNIQFWDKSETSTQAFSASSPDKILLSVRGTTDTADWEQNLKADSVPFEEGPSPRHTATGDPLHVHEGFYEAFRSLKGDIGNYLDENLEGDDGKKSVFVCGHSLGGAVAFLIAASLQSNRGVPPILYTYGMPRVGERAFAEHYGQNGRNPLIHHRHVHHQDPVPQSPPPQYEGDPRDLVRNRSPIVPADLIVHAVREALTQVNRNGSYAHHGQLTYLPPVQHDWAKPVLDPQATDIVSLTEKARNVPSVFFETDDRVETGGHQLADHGRIAYVTVIRRRVNYEINSFLDGACGTNAELDGSRLGARDSSGNFQGRTEAADELREKLQALWEKEETLIAEERQDSQEERRPARRTGELKQLHEEQEQVEDALFDALKRRAATFKDERSFLMMTPEWPEFPCETLKRFQGEAEGAS